MSPRPWIGTPRDGQRPVDATSTPQVYWTASGWGIRVDQPRALHSHMGTEGACVSMPPEHWRATVLKILHLTEGHDLAGHGFADAFESCTLCRRIAEWLATAATP